MRKLALLTLLFLAAVYGQSFDVASVKPSQSGGISCSGGPGTTSPGIWRCSNLPLAVVISRAFNFPVFQFSPHDPCCLARFDFEAKVPAGTTGEQFDRMLQNLLRERFKLSLHYQKKEMAIYQMTVGPKGTKLKEAPAPGPSEPWWLITPTIGYSQDGYPLFADGHGGLAGGAGGRRRWVGVGVSAHELAATLTNELGRAVVDDTGLHGNYDVDLKWVVDLDSMMSDRTKAEVAEQVGSLPETASSPSLLRAVQDQLGLKLTAKNGPGEIVVIDHVEKIPVAN